MFYLSVICGLLILEYSGVLSKDPSWGRGEADFVLRECKWNSMVSDEQKNELG